jgi:zinc transport system permease protein
LIINSLLILPAAAARNISGNVRQYHVFSLIFAFVSGIAGLILSYYWGTATGATIVLISAGFYILTFLSKKKVS